MCSLFLLAHCANWHIKVAQSWPVGAWRQTEKNCRVWVAGSIAQYWCCWFSVCRRLRWVNEESVGKNLFSYVVDLILVEQNWQPYGSFLKRQQAECKGCSTSSTGSGIVQISPVVGCLHISYTEEIQKALLKTSWEQLIDQLQHSYSAE